MSLGFPDIIGMRQAAREAADKPADRDDFKQYNLNFWADYSASPFVEMDLYDVGAKPVDIRSLKKNDEPCWLAVDLSATEDLTVILAAWRDGEGYQVWPWYFCPKDNLSRRAEKDGVPYPLWAEQGYITPTPGNVVDFRAVEAKIRKICERLNVQEIAFDPHMGRVMIANLLEDGFPAVEMRQGWVTMAPAVKELERAILARRFRHGGHPVLRWNFSNIAMHTDTAGNRTFHKGMSTDRIDGAQAAAMAVARAAEGGDGGATVYDDEGARPDGLMTW
jgi:phage terminase large subunit-like protein